jgi:hypothetical protein
VSCHGLTPWFDACPEPADGSKRQLTCKVRAMVEVNDKLFEVMRDLVNTPSAPPCTSALALALTLA